MASRSAAESLDSSASFAAVHFRRSTCRCASVSRAGGELLFDEGRQREIEIVAAKKQVLADGNPFEGQLSSLDRVRE